MNEIKFKWITRRLTGKDYYSAVIHFIARQIEQRTS